MQSIIIQGAYLILDTANVSHSRKPIRAEIGHVLYYVYNKNHSTVLIVLYHFTPSSLAILHMPCIIDTYANSNLIICATY
jgi:hypothetical protein